MVIRAFCWLVVLAFLVASSVTAVYREPVEWHSYGANTGCRATTELQHTWGSKDEVLMGERPVPRVFVSIVSHARARACACVLR